MNQEVKSGGEATTRKHEKLENLHFLHNFLFLLNF